MVKYCATCGVELSWDGKCPKCGKVYPETDGGNTTTAQKNDTNDGFFEKATMPLTELTGENDFVDLKLRDLFSKVFKRHSLDEAESIFIVGTKKTTPPISSLSEQWPKPWLYSRVFFMFLITFLFLYICFELFQNQTALPAMIFMGAVAIPFSLTVFFTELNVPRNISFYEVLKNFFIGGGASLVVTVILFTVFPPSADGSLDYAGAIIVGIVEEIAKLLVVVYFIRKNKEANYVLNGILIGACVGAGFAAFETAGYILNYGLAAGKTAMMDVLGIRAVLAPGGHVAWAAILGGAVMLVKRANPFKVSYLFNKKFLSFALMPVAMHAVWDMPIIIGNGEVPVIQIALTVLAWVVLLVLTSAGLKEVSRYAKNARVNSAQQYQTTTTV